MVQVLCVILSGRIFYFQNNSSHPGGCLSTSGFSGKLDLLPGRYDEVHGVSSYPREYQCSYHLHILVIAMTSST